MPQGWAEKGPPHPGTRPPGSSYIPLGVSLQQQTDTGVTHFPETLSRAARRADSCRHRAESATALLGVPAARPRPPALGAKLPLLFYQESDWVAATRRKDSLREGKVPPNGTHVPRSAHVHSPGHSPGKKRRVLRKSLWELQVHGALKQMPPPLYLIFRHFRPKTCRSDEMPDSGFAGSGGRRGGQIMGDGGLITDQVCLACWGDRNKTGLGRRRRISPSRRERC